MEEKPHKTKVLYVITKGNWGGAQRYVYDLATHLPREQFEAVVACGGESNLLVGKIRRHKLRAIKIESLKRDISLVSEVRAFFEMLDLMRAEAPQVVHLNSSKAGGLGALAARLAGVPRVIFTGHGWAWNEDRSLLSKIIIGFAHWLTILLSHETIAVAGSIKNQISSLPFTKNKITVIHNGIEAVDLYERDEARRILNSEINEKHWIGTISELHKNKGLDFLIKAFAEILKTHNSLALVIIGSGEEEKKLRLLAGSLNISHKVHLLGFVEKASQYIKAFDIFTLTSRTEAFPYTTLEAGLAQTPIIASAVGGIPEQIENEKTGLLTKPGDVEKIANNMVKILDNPDITATYAQAMRKRVEETFSLDAMVQKTISLYNI